MCVHVVNYARVISQEEDFFLFFFFLPSVEGTHTHAHTTCNCDCFYTHGYFESKGERNVDFERNKKW